MKKISFAEGYFSDIKRIELKRVPLESPGTFENVIIVKFKPWWKLSEKFSFESEEEANKLFSELQEIMNSKTLDELLIK